jgi:hypothetical protein
MMPGRQLIADECFKGICVKLTSSKSKPILIIIPKIIIGDEYPFNVT